MWSNIVRTAAGLLTSALVDSALPPAWVISPDQGFGRRRVAGVIDDDGQAIAGEAAGDGRADTARGTGDEGDSGGVHGVLLGLGGCGKNDIYSIGRDNPPRIGN